MGIINAAEMTAVIVAFIDIRMSHSLPWVEIDQKISPTG
jgi:hypothetical protein